MANRLMQERRKCFKSPNIFRDKQVRQDDFVESSKVVTYSFTGVLEPVHDKQWIFIIGKHRGNVYAETATTAEHS